MLDGDSVGVGIQVGHGLVFRNPATKDFIGNGQLTGLVVHFDDDVFAEILERNFGAQASLKIPDLAGPLLKLQIMGDTAFERDGFEFGAAR